ncbi:sugar transferase [Agrobacterium albertimagni AOL15]|uniref:Sugar transferase n=2 Tax=Agrobacterium albertimagni TaxID=147266 RepID=K2PCN2_9HYPH|nr:sugar transferase [Agrobacterium albertimagni AOL15]
MSVYSNNFSERDARLASPPETVRRGAKRAFDIGCSLLLLLFLLPAFLLIAAALLLVDGGPVIFRHQRVGRGGRAFSCLKFRSMRKDADKVLAELLEKDPERRGEWEESQKLKRDPRIHWLGKLLRITSLDELPQLFNILAGDMSIVGPRPIVSEELERYGQYAHCYLAMTPGLTGLWQVSRCPETTYEERVQFDVDYYNTCSMRTDITIIMKTIVVVLFAQNEV